ncbi:hypothetical protein BH18THE2_BH18THE2_07150 [soil metagenome]
MKKLHRIVMIICYTMREGIKYIHEVFWTNTALDGYFVTECDIEG